MEDWGKEELLEYIKSMTYSIYKTCKEFRHKTYEHGDVMNFLEEMERQCNYDIVRKVKKEMEEKDKTCPKKVKSAFEFFKEYTPIPYSQWTDDQKDAYFEDMWSKLTSKQRELYKSMEREDQKRHKIEMNTWYFKSLTS